MSELRKRDTVSSRRSEDPRCIRCGAPVLNYQGGTRGNFCGRDCREEFFATASQSQIAEVKMLPPARQPYRPVPCAGCGKQVWTNRQTDFKCCSKVCEERTNKALKARTRMCRERWQPPVPERVVVADDDVSIRHVTVEAVQ